MTEEEGKKETKIGEVGHLFLSGQESSSPAPPTRRGIPVLAVACPRGSVSRSIFTVDLAAELSMRGNRTAIFPQVSLAPNTITLLGFGGAEVAPKEEGLRLLEGPFGICLILAEGGASSRHMGPKLIAVLEEMTQKTGILLIELPEAVAKKDAPLLALADQVILLVPPDPDVMTESFRQLITISEIAPNRGILIVAIEVDEERDAEYIFREMDDLSQDFLGRRLEFLGYVCKDPRHFLLALEDPAAFTRRGFLRVRKCMHDIGEIISLEEDFMSRTCSPRTPLSRRT